MSTAAVEVPLRTPLPVGTLQRNEITIDREFQALVAPLSAEEYDLLKSQILTQGCLAPLVVWKNEDGQRILLDGHNRHEICTKHNRDFQTRNIKLADREQAKLWILEHQAGRRNLTDDQRAIIWNEIREQRSRVEKAKRTEAATEARRHPDVSSKTTDTKPRADTRAAVAKEAKLPENKLKVAQRLKKYQFDLYKNVLAGTTTLRDTNKLLKQAAAEDLRKRYSEKDFYNRVCRNLHSLFKHNYLDERLKELMSIKKSHWCPSAEEGIGRLLHNLGEVSKQTTEYVKTLRAILKANKGKYARIQ